ncbi:MAG: MCE family protein [Alphaproteobacteria bacterium]|nr:MCE family protein [Alphaproteobacteria bacterium]
MSPSPNRRAVLVGLFVTVAVAILAGGILTIGDIHSTFTRKITVHAVFPEVSGLQVGDNVWAAGLKVGTVSELGFVGPGEVQVALEVDRDAAPFIHGDALAKIGSDGLIGNRIVVLHGGTDGSSSLADGATLGTDSSVSTEEVLDTLQKNNENLLAITSDLKDVVHKVSEGEGTVGRLLMEDGLYEDVRGTVASLQQASDNAVDLTHAIAAFAADLNKPGTLPHQITHDTTTFAKLTDTVDRLKEAGEAAKQLVTGLADTVKDPNTPVGTLLHDREAGGDVKQTLAQLNESTALLAEDLEALQHNFLLRPYFKKKEREEAKGK